MILNSFLFKSPRPIIYTLRNRAPKNPLSCLYIYHFYRLDKLAVKVNKLLGVQEKDGPAESTPKARKQGDLD